MPSLTLEDIARKTGVSRSTVSRVINNQPNVREDVRKKVQDAIQETGFHPHAAARALASQHSSTIGLILPHSVSLFFNDPYFQQITKGIAQSCNQHDYTLALFLVGSKEDEKSIFPRVSRKGLLDGVLVQSGHHGDQYIIGQLVDKHIPMVVLGRPFRSDNVTYIDIDNVQASYEAVSHLIQLGRKRIATITGPKASAVGLDRLEGYRKALRENKLPADESLIVEGEFTEASGYSAMQMLVLSKPDAIFAASDAMAIGAIRATRELGIRVPEDIAFVGFDDLPIATLSNIQLTTVRQPVLEFCIRAVEALIDKIENDGKQPYRIIMDTELIVRESCGAAKA